MVEYEGEKIGPMHDGLWLLNFIVVKYFNGSLCVLYLLAQ